MKRANIYKVLFAVAFFSLAFIKPALCFLILGGVILYFAIASIRLQKKISIRGIECTGRILSFETDSDGDKTPLIEFTPIGGTMITAKPYIYTSTDFGKIRSYDHLIGSEVLVRYDPDDPRKFALTQEGGFNVIVLVLFILGSGVFIAVGIADLTGFIRLGH